MRAISRTLLFPFRWLAGRRFVLAYDVYTCRQPALMHGIDLSSSGTEVYPSHINNCLYLLGSLFLFAPKYSHWSTSSKLGYCHVTRTLRSQGTLICATQRTQDSGSAIELSPSPVICHRGRKAMPSLCKGGIHCAVC